MNDTDTQVNSGQQMLNAVEGFAEAGISLIQIRTREPMRAAQVLREHFIPADVPYHEWSPSRGWRDFTVETFRDNSLAGDDSDAITALGRPLADMRNTSPTAPLKARPDVVHYYVFLEAQSFFDNPFVKDLIQQYATFLPMHNLALIFITDDAPLDVPIGLVNVTELTTPKVGELVEQLEAILENAREAESNIKDFDVSDEDLVTVAQMGLGLSSNEFETHASLAITSTSDSGEEVLTVDHLLTGIAVGKTEVVRQSSILELMKAGDMSEVGGMNTLKTWISQRKNCFSDEAKEFGISAPKGMVLVGVPGTGKSLSAKAVASELGVPLVRLDFGRVFSKFVGESETQVRQALKMVESMAPCVLFVDEIDKGLGGVANGGGGDSGVSMRVLGTYLTWLQELSAPVFNIVTANRIDGLPPELLRRGRFDQIFSVALPSARERLEVLQIHLRMRNQDIELTAAEESTYVTVSEGYVPAEIASAVNDGLILAFSQGEEFSCSHVITALRDMIPMSRSNKARIDAIVAWAKDNAIPVHNPDNDEPVAPRRSIAKAGTRRLSGLNKAKRK